MTGIEALGIAISSVVVPYIVALVKGEAITGKAALVVAVAVSLLAGGVVGFAAGIPSTPEAWVMCLLAAVCATQAVYALFKQVGVTNKWMDALSAIHKDSDAVEAVRKNQAMADKAEEAIRKFNGR